MALHLQSPTKSAPSLAPTNNAGLRRPFNPFAMKSSSFTGSLSLLLHPNQYHLITSAAPRISMRVASKESYICRDCGYIYNERTPFEKLPDKYFCPDRPERRKLSCLAMAEERDIIANREGRQICGAPKRRFRPYAPAVSKNANATDVRKARKAEIQKDEAIGKALPIAIAVGVVVLAGLYFYLNSQF